jgi:hypothetical protein
LLSVLDALLLIGNGSEKFAMQVQVKNFQNEAAQFASSPKCCPRNAVSMVPRCGLELLM